MRGQPNFASPSVSKRFLCLGAIILSVFLGASTAFAEAGFEYRVDKKVQTDAGLPTLVLRAAGGIKSGTVTLKSRDGKTAHHKLGAMKSGEIKKIAIKQSSGTHQFEITVKATGVDGEAIEDV